MMLHLSVWTIIVLWVSKEILAPATRMDSKFGITRSAEGPGLSESLTILDFPSHFNFARKTWLRQTTVNAGHSVYSRENHLKVSSEWAGVKLDSALLFGYSPTMIWVLAPLIACPPGAAFCLFNMAGLLMLWWTTHPSRCRLGVGLLSFGSPLALACFALGQTALLTAAGLLFIAESTRAGSREGRWRQALLAGAVLWALTAKPPLALTAGAALVGTRHWRPLLAAAILTSATTLAITPLLGRNWAYDYLQLIGSYDLVNGGAAFAGNFVPGQMANLRGILSVDFRIADDIASHISSVLWGITLLCIAAFGSRNRCTEGAIWSFGILAYLLLCPHVTSTEELQLMLLLPLNVRPQNRLGRRELALLVMIPLLPFASPAIGLFAGSRAVLFSAKVVLVVLIAAGMRQGGNDVTQYLPEAGKLGPEGVAPHDA